MKHFCSLCQMEKENSEFNYKNNVNKVQSYCRDCQTKDRSVRKLLKNDKKLLELVIKLRKEFGL